MFGSCFKTVYSRIGEHPKSPSKAVGSLKKNHNPMEPTKITISKSEYLRTPALSRRRTRSPRDRRRAPARMDDIIGRVVNGRVFKGVVALCSGGRLRQNNIPRRHSAPDLDEAEDQSMLEPPPEGETPDLELHPTSQHSYPGIKTQYQEPGSSKGMTLDINADLEPEVATSRNPAPTPRAHYIDIVQLRSKDGQMISAVTLTEKQIYQWNKILKHERTITHCMDQLANNESQMHELNTFITEVQTELDATTDNPLADREQSMQELETGLQLREECESQRRGWLQKLEDARHALERPKTRLYADWERTLGKYNLLNPPTPTTSAPTSEAPPPEEFQHKTPTPSEVALQEAVTAREEAEAMVREHTFKLQDAQQKHDNWNTFYEDELKAYKKHLERGETETTRTEFDLMLLKEQRAVAGDLRIAERELEEVMDHAIKAGVVFNELDLESQFPDHADDGYRLSLEHDVVQHVDRSRIEKWMAEKEDRPNHSVDCDDWDSRTVELHDSISVVAEGKQKAKIEKWRKLCEENKVEIPVGLDDILD